MKVLKICTGTWGNASRDQRELNVCRDLGAETVILAKGNEDDRGREDDVNGFRVFRCSSRPYKQLPVPINRFFSVFQWARFASKLEADVITGHDIDGWTIGWLSKLFRGKKKPILVYDSHEFELGRNKKRNKIHLYIIKLWEKKVINSSAFTMVVNDSIADELVKIHRLKKRPVVIRNIPDKWNIDPVKYKQKREELKKEFEGCNEKSILIYHGAVSHNRGIEQLLLAVADLEGVNLLILGNPESEEYKNELIEKYIQPIKDRIIVKSAVPHDQLWEYIGAADLCIALIVPKYRSYFYALPNKLFEAIQAGTPILVSNLPEMKRIVEEYNIGECVEVDDIEAIKSAIKKMLEHGRQPYEKGIEKAQKELTWDNEKETLKKAYSTILHS
ncbi:MAG: glycosyltransferase [Mogibacterium sp.]|nr:glycosyltransferase [Mogibacterium sp.]